MNCRETGDAIRALRAIFPSRGPPVAYSKAQVWAKRDLFAYHICKSMPRTMRGTGRRSGLW